MQMENQDNVLSWVGEQALIGEGILTPADVLKMVDGISAADVNTVSVDLLFIYLFSLFSRKN